MSNNKPENLRQGALNLAIWTNQGSKGPFQTVDLTRSYKDAAGEWKTTRSLRAQDIDDARDLLEQAKVVMAAMKTGAIQPAAEQDTAPDAGAPHAVQS